MVSDADERSTAPRIVCAPNAFKGTLTAAVAAAAMARGVHRARPDAVTVEVPVADGGDGTLDVLLAAVGGRGRVEVITVTGPTGAPVAARLGWIGATTSVVELAEASGLRLLGHPPGPLDALRAGSRGVGELIRHALDGGAGRIVVGLGGSACTDGGAGLLAGLGMRLLDGSGRALADGGGALVDLGAVDVTDLHPGLRRAQVEVAVDTRAPLLGAGGAAALFAPQKGAGPAEVERLEAGLGRLVAIAGAALGADPALATRPMTGAAGGCSWALGAAGARLAGGAALVCDAVGLDAALEGAALAITGEGRLDLQTATGKAPFEVRQRAAAAGVPCVAVAGRADAATPGWGLVVTLEELAAEHGLDPFGDAETLVEAAAAEAARRALRPR